VRLLENILEAGQQFLNGILISRSVEDDEHSGRPSTSKTTENVEKKFGSIHEDYRQTIHELTDTVGISYGVCQDILTENLNMHRSATKFVPQLLTDDQKQQRVKVYLEL
jgi:hypothetical protein